MFCCVVWCSGCSCIPVKLLTCLLLTVDCCFVFVLFCFRFIHSGGRHGFVLNGPSAHSLHDGRFSVAGHSTASSLFPLPWQRSRTVSHSSLERIPPLYMVYIYGVKYVVSVVSRNLFCC